MRNLVKDFTEDERLNLLNRCCFTKSELELFVLREDEDNSLERCAEAMNVSVKTVGRINKRMNEKILKIKGDD